MSDDATLAGSLALDPTVARTLAAAPGATIRPEGVFDTRGKAALVGLAAGLAGGAGVELGEVIGRGGMGVVYRGTQLRLGRTVAVKALPPERASDGQRLKLLREAWVTGHLGHPNIMPVHDLEVGPDGAPRIVLGLIEGCDWSALIRDEDRVRAEYGGDDLLDWNLGVLDQVCNAVRFAHARGIVHRDLKPANVMIGRFGQVYVVDWGIAVSLEAGDGRMPLAREVREVAGTPAYMAPEMLLAEADRIGPPTDVYLLGAILFEIVTGKAPHGSASVETFVGSVMSSPPDPGDGVPAGLAPILARAMAREPGARYDSVEDFQRALRDFQRHRGASRLTEAAADKLARLAATDDATDRARLFAECRFAFREALAQWPDLPDARAGLRQAVGIMVERALAEGNPQTAKMLLAEHDDLPRELVAQVEEALAAHEDQARELADLRAKERERDVRVGAKTRAFVIALLAVLGIFASGAWLTSPPTSPLAAAQEPGLFLLSTLALWIWARQSLQATAFNRRVISSVAFVFFVHTVSAVAGMLAGIPPLVLVRMEVGMWFLASGLFTILIDRRLVAVTVGYLVAFLAMMGLDLGWQGGMWAYGAANLVAGASVLAIWWPWRARPEGGGQVSPGRVDPPGSP